MQNEKKSNDMAGVILIVAGAFISKHLKGVSEVIFTFFENLMNLALLGFFYFGFYAIPFLLISFLIGQLQAYILSPTTPHFSYIRATFCFAVIVTVVFLMLGLPTKHYVLQSSKNSRSDNYTRIYLEPSLPNNILSIAAKLNPHIGNKFNENTLMHIIWLSLIFGGPVYYSYLLTSKIEEHDELIKKNIQRPLVEEISSLEGRLSCFRTKTFDLSEQIDSLHFEHSEVVKHLENEKTKLSIKLKIAKRYLDRRKDMSSQSNVTPPLDRVIENLPTDWTRIVDSSEKSEDTAAGKSIYFNDDIKGEKQCD